MYDLRLAEQARRQVHDEVLVFRDAARERELARGLAVDGHVAALRVQLDRDASRGSSGLPLTVALKSAVPPSAGTFPPAPEPKSCVSNASCTFVPCTRKSLTLHARRRSPLPSPISMPPVALMRPAPRRTSAVSSVTFEPLKVARAVISS